MKHTPGPERAYKAWYKEMLAILKERWHEGLSWEENETLCGGQRRRKREMAARTAGGYARGRCGTPSAAS